MKLAWAVAPVSVSVVRAALVAALVSMRVLGCGLVVALKVALGSVAAQLLRWLRLVSVVALASVRALGCGLVVVLKAALGSVAARP